MEQNQYFKLEDQAALENQINGCDSIQAIQPQMLNSQSSANTHNFIGPPLHIHAESSSFQPSRMGNRAVDLQRRILWINEEVKYYKILKLVKTGKLSVIQMIKLTKDQAHELIIHPIGNKFIRILLQLCNQTYINLLLHSLIDKQDLFLSVCLHDFGHKILIKLMDDLIHTYQQIPMTSAIGCHVVALAKSSRFGHQVLHRCFLKFPPQANELILLKIAKNCLEIAIDQAGCCILQVCIQYASEHVREALVSPLIRAAEYLSMHCFGNYVIQFMIILDGEKVGGRIIERLRKKLVRLCLDKCGSNVVEKCLLYCNQAYVDDIIFEIMDNDYHQIQLSSNQYGNFVVQTAISVAKGKCHKFLVRAIQNHRFDLQFNWYGRHVIAAVDNILRMSNLRLR